MLPLKAIGAFALFFFILACAIASEAAGRLRHGREWESGDGIGSPEDYEI